MAGILDVDLAAANAVTLAVTTAYGPANGHRLLDPRGGLAHGCRSPPDMRGLGATADRSGRTYAVRRT